jgi:hypothetical protein
LNSVPAIGSVEIFFVQDEPEFKARVRATDTDARAVTPVYCSIEIWMLVSVEDSPYLVVFFERALWFLAPRAQAQRPRKIGSSGCNSVRDTRARKCIHLD